jgi:hypothetical protein
MPTIQNNGATIYYEEHGTPPGDAVLDAFYQNFYGAGFVYSADRAFVASVKTPC